MSRGLWLGIAVLLMVGCAAKLTPGGAMVREGDVAVLGECEFLGIVEANDRGARVAAGVVGGTTGFSDGALAGQVAGRRVSGSSAKMLRHIRNEVAELGGDVFVVVGVDRFELQAEAYRCWRSGSAAPFR